MNVLRRVGIGLGVVALLAVGFWQLDHESTPFLKPVPTKQQREVAGLKTITAYCQYGSVSMAQIKGCYFHVHLTEVQERDTNAAKWAKGELDECLSDAGPFCGTKYRATLERRIDERVAEKEQADAKFKELEEKYGSP